MAEGSKDAEAAEAGVAGGDAQPAQQQSQTMKSSLTMMLAQTPALSAFHDIFSAVPRKAGTEPEVAPLETLDIPMGTDFALKLGIILLKSLIGFYFFAAIFGIISAVSNMVAGSCGQDTWKVPAEEACQELIYGALAIHERRCFADKPPQMSAEDFENVCGDNGSMIAGLVLAACYALHMVYKNVARMKTKVRFHKDFFTVESIDGKSFQGSFYADVTEASTGIIGLSMATKARIELQAGGADASIGTKGKLLRILEDKHIKISCGSGQTRQEFLGKIAKYVTVDITGFQGQATPAKQANHSATMVEGRLRTILDARKADASSFVAVRMPMSADLLTAFLFIAVVVVVPWYLITRISALIEFAVANGEGKCMDPLRPGVDLCAVKRIFYPINVPIINPSDWINLILAIVFPLLGPAYYISMFEVEYRFHRDGPIQEVLYAGWESQPNKFVFPNDVEAMERVDGSMKKYFKLDVRAHYTIEGGITGPYKLTATFAPKTVKMALVNASCASCSGHGQAAKEHEDKLQQALKEAKPGMLPGDGGAEAGQNSQSEVRPALCTEFKQSSSTSWHDGHDSRSEEQPGCFAACNPCDSSSGVAPAHPPELGSFKTQVLSL